MLSTPIPRVVHRFVDKCGDKHAGDTDRRCGKSERACEPVQGQRQAQMLGLVGQVILRTGGHRASDAVCTTALVVLQQLNPSGVVLGALARLQRHILAASRPPDEAFAQQPGQCPCDRHHR